MKKSSVAEIISAILIILFTYAAISKIMNYEMFRFQLGKSPYTTRFSSLIAWMLPAFELLVSFLLVKARTRLAGLYASFLLMVMFTGYIYAILHYSNYIPCSCGGILSRMGWHQHLIFNIVFTLLSLFGILFYSPNGSCSVVTSNGSPQIKSL